MSTSSLLFAAFPNQVTLTASIEQCNELSARFGLSLRPEEARALAQTNLQAVQESLRLEFGGGIAPRLIETFCDSPHLHKNNYAETLHILITCFYELKNDCMDLINDEDLLNAMKTCFDQSCHGSLDRLLDRELPALAHNLRFGFENETIFDDSLGIHYESGLA